MDSTASVEGLRLGSHDREVPPKFPKSSSAHFPSWEATARSPFTSSVIGNGMHEGGGSLIPLSNAGPHTVAETRFVGKSAGGPVRSTTVTGCAATVRITPLKRKTMGLVDSFKGMACRAGS
jgi:hypothetical protein